MAGGQRKKREQVEAPPSFPLLRKGIRCVVLRASFPSMNNMCQRKKSPAAANSIQIRAASLFRVASSSLSISQVVSAASSRVQAFRLRLTARQYGDEDLDLEAGPAPRLDDLEERTKNVEKLADQVVGSSCVHLALCVCLNVDKIHGTSVGCVWLVSCRCLNEWVCVVVHPHLPGHARTRTPTYFHGCCC